MWCTARGPSFMTLWYINFILHCRVLSKMCLPHWMLIVLKTDWRALLRYIKQYRRIVHVCACGRWSIRPGSQYDARHLRCIVSSLRNVIIFKFSQFFMTRRKSATQRNVRIESESILALLYVVTSINAKATQRNTRPCVIFWTSLKPTLLLRHTLWLVLTNIL